jgi:hypothetical protein
MLTTFCPCGSLLHYSDPVLQVVVERSIERFGPTVAVTTSAGTWFVDRHYYALHGLKRAALPRLARKYHWAKYVAPAVITVRMAVAGLTRQMRPPGARSRAS